MHLKLNQYTTITNYGSSLNFLNDNGLKNITLCVFYSDCRNKTIYNNDMAVSIPLSVGRFIGPLLYTPRICIVEYYIKKNCTRIVVHLSSGTFSIPFLF